MLSRERKLMLIKISRYFQIVKRRAIRVYNEMSTIVKENYNDEIFINALIKNICRAVRMRKEIEQ